MAELGTALAASVSAVVAANVITWNARILASMGRGGCLAPPGWFGPRLGRGLIVRVRSTMLTIAAGRLHALLERYKAAVDGAESVAGAGGTPGINRRCLGRGRSNRKRRDGKALKRAHAPLLDFGHASSPRHHTPRLNARDCAAQ